MFQHLDIVRCVLDSFVRYTHDIATHLQIGESIYVDPISTNDRYLKKVLHRRWELLRARWHAVERPNAHAGSEVDPADILIIHKR